MFKKTDILFYKDAGSLAFVIAASLSLIIIFIKLTAYTELIFAAPNIFATLAVLFLYLLPAILTTILPIAVFTACTLIATRMAADREMDALFSSGMSVGQILLAPLAFGVLTFLLMLGNSLYYEPYSKEQFRFFKWYQARQIMESFVVNNVREKSFLHDFPLVEKNKVVFYTDSISKSRVLSDIFIGLESNEPSAETQSIFVAKHGNFLKIFSNGYPDFVFTLSDGTMYSSEKTVMQFSQLNVSLLNAFSDKLKSSDDYRPKRRSVFRDLKPFSAALCALFFPALGMCLGLFNTHNKPFRVYIGIGMITIIFYALLSLCRILIGRFAFSPFLIYSIPPLIFCLSTIFLARERHKIK